MSHHLFICENCGAEYFKWAGKCSVCGEWNTLIKQPEGIKKPSLEKLQVVPEKLSEIKIEHLHRFPTFSKELDRVLGGGIVSGSLILLGGEPGIGKSTLLLQTASSFVNNQQVQKAKVLYVSGEESPQQLKIRAERLGVNSQRIYLLSETNVQAIAETARLLAKPKEPLLLIVDSIQTMYHPDYPSTPGSLVQVRESALQLQILAKKLAIPIFLVGHLTKEGSVAGPKTLEHLVDVVLYLEGERYQNLRLLQSAKNRFGTVEEVGVFEMGAGGLSEIEEPSKLFLKERIEVPGSAITSVLTGSRAFLVEIQALASKTPFGYPKRIVSGFDYKRLDLLLAVLQKRIKLPLSAYDVYVNIIGGIKVEDRAADLALCASIFSIFQNKPLKPKTILLGEVGLSGEIRSVSQLERRNKEARRLGFVNFIGPKEEVLERALKLALES